MIGSRFIVIAGGSGSGKSRLAGRLQQALGPRTSLITLDHFYHDLAHLPLAERDLVNFDHPDAIDWPAVQAVVASLKSGLTAEIPRYDFATHTRLERGDRLDATPWVVLEGLWPLKCEAIRSACTLSVFIDCPSDVRLCRRIARDTLERGRSEESVRRQYVDFVAPMHELHVQPQLGDADLVFGPDFGEPEILGLLNHPFIASA